METNELLFLLLLYFRLNLYIKKSNTDYKLQEDYKNKVINTIKEEKK
jgi:hypothetical protein